MYPRPEDYFPRTARVCDRYEVLLIADEVITGFGRIGSGACSFSSMTARHDVDRQGDHLGYVPMGAAVWSEEVHETITQGPGKFMHAYTNAGHPTAAAVGLRNLQIFEDEGLVDNAAARGEQLLSGLQRLTENPHIGNIRGLGFMCGFDILKDPETDEAFPAEDAMGAKLLNACQSRGLISRVRNDGYLLAPPLVATEEEVNEILNIVEDSVREVTAAL